jgi:hypothetical protein
VGGRSGPSADRLRGLGRRRDACASLVHRGINSPAEGSGVTIRIRYRILNARFAAGAVSGGGVDQAYDGWRVVSQFEFQHWWKADIRSSRRNHASVPKADL